jgi:hypothetical protein
MLVAMRPKLQSRRGTLLLAAILLMDTVLLTSPSLAQPIDGHTFPETGQRVEGRFWEVWLAGRSFDDSLYINGLPITARRIEVSPTDGKSYRTQWFERARFEDHPENQPPSDVLLGLLGVAATRGRQDEPFQPISNQGGNVQWFPETRHTLGDSTEEGQVIAAFWNRLGGLPQFGYPLSQPFRETSKDDGKAYVVQYFERQRFEYHPENKGTRFEVLLGRLGAEQERKATPTPSSVPISPTPQATSTPIPTATPNIAALCEDIPAPDGVEVVPRCAPPSTTFALVAPRLAEYRADVIFYVDGEEVGYVNYQAYPSRSAVFRYKEGRVGLHHVRVAVFYGGRGREERHGHFRVHP